MDLNAAEIFVRVVEARGFSAAARLLGMPKTTVSKKVGDLEADLGVRLLSRTTRRISTTAAGEEVYRHCVIALRHMEAAVDAVQVAQHVPSGLLTVAAPGPIGVPFLLPAITAFMERYPSISITHLAVDSPIDLAEAGIDVLLSVASSAQRFENVLPIATVEIGLFASAGYIQLHGLPTMPPHLAAHVAIAPTQAMTGNHFAWTLDRGGEVVTVAPNTTPRLRSNDGGALLAAVAAGHGIGSLPLRLVEASPAGNALVAILPEWRVPAIELSAHYRDGGTGNLKTRLFLDFVTDWFRTN